MSTFTTFGMLLDITMESLRIEHLIPVDAKTWESHGPNLWTNKMLMPLSSVQHIHRCVRQTLSLYWLSQGCGKSPVDTMDCSCRSTALINAFNDKRHGEGISCGSIVYWPQPLIIGASREVRTFATEDMRSVCPSAGEAHANEEL